MDNTIKVAISEEQFSYTSAALQIHIIIAMLLRGNYYYHFVIGCVHSIC